MLDAAFTSNNSVRVAHNFYFRKASDAQRHGIIFLSTELACTNPLNLPYDLSGAGGALVLRLN